MAIKIFIADDHDTVTDGLLAILRPLPDIDVVGRARNGAELERMLSRKPVDVLMLDLSMPVRGGMAVIPALRAQRPGLKIIVLSSNRTFRDIDDALRAGADSYLTKDAGKQDIIAAIRAVSAGNTYYNDTVREVLATGQRGHRQQPEAVSLTPRERVITCLIAQELTSKEIGEKLSISHLTVERHRRNLFSKLDVKNVVGLVKFAMRNDLVRDDWESLLHE